MGPSLGGHYSAYHIQYIITSLRLELIPPGDTKLETISYAPGATLKGKEILGMRQA